MTSPHRHRVAVLLLAPIVGFDATIPGQLFSAAVDERGRPLYDVRMVGLDRAPVATTEGYAVLPQEDAAWLAHADTLIVPGTRYEPARVRGELPGEVRAALAGVRPGTRRVSICTGAFVFAAAGWFDGVRATTHWAYAEEFQALYPQVELDVDVLFTDGGDVLSSAGVAAGIDMCLHLIRRDHGSGVANVAARHCVVPPWREGGQAQFIERPIPDVDQRSTASVREWALARLSESLDVAALARVAGMSVRTFNRRFREETGLPPGAWLVEQRVAYARHLLEATDDTIDDIADRAGFGTGATLRHHFRGVVGVAPASYRSTFRGAVAR